MSSFKNLLFAQTNGLFKGEFAFHEFKDSEGKYPFSMKVYKGRFAVTSIGKPYEIQIFQYSYKRLIALLPYQTMQDVSDIMKSIEGYIAYNVPQKKLTGAVSNSVDDLKRKLH